MALNTSSNLPPTPTYRPFPSEAAQQALNRTLAELTPSYPEHQHNSIHLAPVFVGSLSDLQSLQEPAPTISSNVTLTPTFQQIMPALNRGFAPTTLQTPRQLIESIPHTINPTDSFPKFVSPQEVLLSNNPSMVLTNPHLPLVLNDAVQQMAPQAHHLQLESVPQTPPNEVNLPDLEIWYITPEFFDTLCGVDVLDCALYGTGILYAVAVTAEVGDSWRSGEFDNVEVKGKEVFLGRPSIEFSIGGQTRYAGTLIC